MPTKAGDLEFSGLERLLKQHDSEHLYFPEPFDYDGEYRRAKEMARSIAVTQNLEAIVDSPSGYQDGALFTRITFKERGAASSLASLLISAFGRFLTTEVQELSAPSEEMIQIAKEFGYVYIPMEYLKRAYQGRHPHMVGETWFYRYFCDFFRVDDGTPGSPRTTIRVVR